MLKFPFRNVIFVDHRVKQVLEKSSKVLRHWMTFKTGHFGLRCEENIVEFLEGHFRNQKFSLSTKRKLSIPWNFPFPFVSFNSVFLTLKCETWKPPRHGVIHRRCGIKHAFSTNQSARYIWTLLKIRINGGCWLNPWQFWEPDGCIISYPWRRFLYCYYSS